MGLFSKKKDSTRTSDQIPSFEAPELPEFPSLPEESDEAPEFPTYEPTIHDIKKEVEGGEEEAEIPIREKDFSGKRIIDLKAMQEETKSKMQDSGEEKPLYVKIDNYKEVMHTLLAVKSKLADVENLLNHFEQVKVQEEEKLEEWKKDLLNIKEKLLSIDRNLFEV